MRFTYTDTRRVTLRRHRPRVPRRHHQVSSPLRRPTAAQVRRLPAIRTRTPHTGVYPDIWFLYPSNLLSRAAYGYDVNSEQFKEWAASQQQQYTQYYAQAGQAGQPAPPDGAAPAPAQPPPPPPPA
jgi:hypothetical protein